MTKKVTPELVDTHCHIHTARADRDDYTAKKWQQAGKTDPNELINDANKAGVTRLVCVGTDIKDSIDAVELTRQYDNVWASVGVHPHEAQDFLKNNHTFKHKFEELLRVRPCAEKVVAIGECGLDYYYENSPRDKQREVLEYQLDLAQKHNLPVIFHVRDAFGDFWSIYDQFNGLKGVMHSFTGDMTDLDQVLTRGLYVGLNGIVTFTKSEEQVEMAKDVPLVKMLMETDAPYLTPKPLRGTICEPGYVKLTAEFLAQLRGETLEHLAVQTTANARELFSLR